MFSPKSILLLFTGNAKPALAAIGELDAGLKGLGKSAGRGGIGGVLGGVASTLAKTVPVAAGLAGIASLKLAGDFQQSMNLLQTQAGYSSQDVQNLSKQVLALGGKVAQTPDELASGLYHIASNGIPASKAMDTLTAAYKLATIGGAGMEESTQAVLAVLNSWPQYMGNATKAAAGLNAIVGAGDMRMEQLTKAFATGVAPAAATFGLGLNDVGAALATLTDNVTPADEAATRLRMTFALLGAPTDKAAGELADLGLSAQDVQGALSNRDFLTQYGITVTGLADDLRKPNGLLVAIGDLRGHLQAAGLSAQQQSAVISHAFGGGRTSAAILTLLSQFDKFKGKYAALNQGANNFDHAWDVTTQNFNFRIHAAIGAVESFGIKLGNWLLPFVNPALDAITNAFTRLGNWWDTDGQKDAQAFFDAVGPVVKALVSIGGFITGTLLGVLKLLGDHMDIVKTAVVMAGLAFVAFKGYLIGQAVIEGVTLAFSALAAVMGGELTAAEAASALGFEGLGLAIDVCLGPIGLFVAAVIFLAAVVLTHFDQVKQIAGAVASFFKDHWKDIGKWLIAPFTFGLPFVISFFVGNWGRIKAVAESVIGWFRDHWKDLVKWLLAPFTLGFSVLIPLAVDNLDKIKGMFTRFKDWIGDRVGDIVNFFKGLPGRIWDALSSLPGKLFDAAKQAIQSFINGIKSMASQAWDAVKSIPLLGSALQMGADVVGDAVSGITTVTGAIANTITGGHSSGGFRAGNGDSVTFNVPGYADGNYATSPTLGIFGEAGPEITSPVPVLKQVVTDSVKAALSSSGAGGGGCSCGGDTTNVTVNNPRTVNDTVVALQQHHALKKLQNRKIAPPRRLPVAHHVPAAGWRPYRLGGPS